MNSVNQSLAGRTAIVRLGVKDLFKFEKFLRLCATRVGQVVNLPSLGNEVDLILDYRDTVLPVEVKSGEIFAPDMIKGLNYYGKLNKQLSSSPVLIYGGSRTFDFKETRILSIATCPSLIPAGNKIIPISLKKQ